MAEDIDSTKLARERLQVERKKLEAEEAARRAAESGAESARATQADQAELNRETLEKVAKLEQLIAKEGEKSKEALEADIAKLIAAIAPHIQHPVEKDRTYTREEIDAATKHEVRERIRRQSIEEREEEMHRLGIQNEGDYELYQQREALKQHAIKVKDLAIQGAAAGWTGAKALGRGATSAARGAANAAGEATDAVGNAGRMGNNAVRNTIQTAAGITSGEHVGFFWIFFIITLLLHVFYFIPTISTSENLGFMLVAFIVPLVFIMGIYIYLRRHEPEEVRAMVMATCLSIVFYALPSVFELLVGKEALQWAVSFAVGGVPVLSVFFAMRIHERTHSAIFNLLFNIYKLIIVLIVLILAVSLFLEFGGPRFGSVDFGSPTDVWEGFRNFTNMVWERAKGILTGTGMFIDRATNPGAYYTGQVEDNKEAPMGVEFTELRPNDKRIGNETPFFVFGTIRTRAVKSEDFIGEDVLIRPTCVIEKEGAPSAMVDPPEMNLVWGTFGQYSCEFPPLGKRGTYTITGTASFPFQTWSYIEYTFVGDEYARNLARKGLDIMQELNIDNNPVATYTSGPVTLGMGGTPQPILVNPTGPKLIQDGTRMGITVSSNWHGGKIGTVDRLELKVPKAFRLKDCDRDPLHPDGAVDTKASEYLSYVFKNPELDSITKYASVSCKLELHDSAAAEALVQEDKMTLSMIGAAYYTYSIEEKTSVQVR